MSLFRRRGEPREEPLRAIRYVRVNDHGKVNQQCWATFLYYGMSVYLLSYRVGYDLGEPITFTSEEGNIIFFNITLRVRADNHSRLTPLVVDLPPMDIFVVTTGSPAAAQLRYLNVGAH